LLSTGKLIKSQTPFKGETQQGKKAENQLGNRNTIHSNNASSGWVFVRGVLENPMAGVFKASKQI